MGNNPVKFSYKQIWFIAYPILISLVMEQLIGMTDTAFMGRVGEVELGASAIAGVYYMTFYMIAFGFSWERISLWGGETEKEIMRR